MTNIVYSNYPNIAIRNSKYVAIWQDRYSSFLFVYFTEKNDGSVVFYFLLFGLDSGYQMCIRDRSGIIQIENLKKRDEYND